MIEVKIPKEIRDFKSKVMFNLTLRQIVCLAVALVINVPTYIYLKPIVGEEATSWIVMTIGVPALLVGFIKKDGMPYERFALVMLRFYFLTPRIRKYKTENIFSYLNEQKKYNNSINSQRLKKKGAKDDSKS